MSKLYNPEIKEQYLATLTEKSSLPVRNALYKACDIEETIEKDLFDFNTEEIRQILWNANSKSIGGVRNILSYLNGYMKWAIGRGYRNSTLNPIINIDTDAESLMEYIDTSRKIFYSNEEIDEIVKKLFNYQDKVTVHLAFYEGLKLDELINLKFLDVDMNNGILKVQRNETDHIKLSNEFSLGLIERAYNEKEYIAINTEARRDLANSEFIVRNTISVRTKNVTQLSKSVLFARISSMRDKFGYDDFTYGALTKSGMIYEALKLYQSGMAFNSDLLSKVAEKYGQSKILVNGYEYYNVSVLKKFINKENIMDLYGVEIEE